MSTVMNPSSGTQVSRQQKVSRIEESRHQLSPGVTIVELPDGVLLDIFDFYLDLEKSSSDVYRYHEDAWQGLVHVCKRWSSIVFASPHRLRLRLVCTNKRPVQNLLDIWPTMPIVIRSCHGMSKPQDANNIIAALKQHDRVCEIDINGWIDDISNSALKKICAMEMGNPFSALTYLRLLSNNEDVPVLPDSFLGGSAPRLQTIHLSGIPFAALPKLLLSTRDLVSLFVRIPTLSRCLSPTAMVTCLSALTRLENLSFGFRFPRSRAVRENQLLPRMSRVVFPALATLIVKGDSEYFEDFIAQIDTPLLDVFYIKFFNQLIFDTPRLHDFITRTEAFKSPHKASIVFSNFNVVVQLFRRDGSPMDEHRILWLDLPCRPSDWQLSSIVQVCRSALPPLPTLECLEIISYREHHDVEDTQLLEVLHLFTSVKNLVLSEILSLPVAAAMGKISGATEVLPALQNLFLQVPQSSKLIEQAIGKYIAARQLSGFPVTVYNWGSESEKYVHWDVGDR